MVKLEELVAEHIKAGSSVQNLTRALLDCGLYVDYQEAFKVAQHELLLAHTQLSHESIMSNPAITQKIWSYTGEKNNYSVHCRNHDTLDNTIVPKDEPFKLVGLDGNTYYPMYPRDPILPISERKGCLCAMLPFTGSSMMEQYFKEKSQEQKAKKSDNASPMNGYRLLDELGNLIEKLEDEFCSEIEDEILAVFKVVLSIKKLSPIKHPLPLKGLQTATMTITVKKKHLLRIV